MDHGATLTPTTTHVLPVAPLSLVAARAVYHHHTSVTQMTRLDCGV